YIRIISGKFKIPEGLLYRQIQDKRIKSRQEFIPGSLRKRRLKPEEKLLAYFFLNPGFIPLSYEYDFTPENFEPDLLYILRKLKELDLNGIDMVKADLLNRICRDDDMLKRAVELTMVEGLPRCNEEEIRAILKKIEERAHETNIDYLKKVVSEKLGRGELSPDDPDFLELQYRTRKLKVQQEVSDV
ncbi:MAG: hypothetical protein ACLFQV_14150, partial [Vulcanimicrobiota bacterium]